MSAPLAHYFYYPVFRRGAAADIPATAADPLSGALPAARVAPNLALQVTATGPSMGASKNIIGGPIDSNQQPDLFLYGPGDVVGFDKRHVVLTEPADGTANFESNYFAGIEFDEPDIPWMFTPAQAAPTAAGAPQGRLRPWLVLIVLADGEYVLTPAATSPGLDSLAVKDVGTLPDLGDSWAWAHTQLTGSLGSDLLGDLVTNSPERFVSRLLCPRMLQPDTHYTGFLVPAFDIGAQAGLSPPAPGAASSPAAPNPAWQVGQTSPVAPLPVYHSFSFSTADAGDFESLAVRLAPQVLTGVGSRPMAVDDARNQASWNVPAATSGNTTLDLHGALDTLPPAGSPPPPDDWSASDQAAFKPGLAKVLNIATPVTGNPSDPDPVVVPPIYGRYHAAVSSVNPTGGGWVNELNLDPRLRGPAGVGAAVVTAQRASLMASAWRQIAGVELANRILRHAQMARAALQQTYQLTFSVLSSISLLTLAANVLRRIWVTSNGVAGSAWSVIASGPIPWRVFFPGFGRLIAPFGPLRTQQGQAGTGSSGLITGINNGTIILTPPNGPGAGTATYPSQPVTTGGTTTTTTGGTTVTISPGGGPLARILGPVPSWLLPWARAVALLVILIAVVLDVVIILAGLAGGWLPTALALAAVILLLAILIIWWLLGTTVTTTTTTTTTTTSTAGYGPPQVIPGGTSLLGGSVSVPPLTGFQVVGVGTSLPPGSVTASSTDSGTAATFRGTMQGVLSTLSGFATTTTSNSPPPTDLGALASSVLSALDPTSTVVRRALSLVSVDSRLQWTPADPIEPIMAAPDFPQPMYAPLRDLSQEYLLPGIGQIPRESAGLLLPNMEFIEAYMVGLNFEMGRQLLWNGYPTDQRGSYFRQFWDVSGYVPGPSDPQRGSTALAEMLKDISPINAWNTGTDIGTHANPASPASGSVLVLMIRGELLRRYPTTHVYAVPGVFTTPGDSSTRVPSADPTQELHPLFRGTMSPDLSYYGFALSPTQAFSAPGYGGYYFVLQQHPTQPRFGLETTASLTTVTWQWFPGGFATVATPNAPTGSTVPAIWGNDAASMASLTFRDPVQVSIHADLMLPGGSGS
jgi:hypothetical protein